MNKTLLVNREAEKHLKGITIYGMGSSETPLELPLEAVSAIETNLYDGFMEITAKLPESRRR